MVSQKAKMEMIKYYGSEITLGYFYYSYNPIKLVGEEQVRKSFDSLKKYGKRVYVGDYSSDDGIKELTEEYGFTYLCVPKTPNVFFHESKIFNKICKEAKENFITYVNFWCYYPDDFEQIIINWLKTHNGSLKCLKMTGYAMDEEGKLHKTKGISHSVSHTLYRPFFYEARGIDERTVYHAGPRNYAVGLITRVFELKIDNIFVPFVHIYHQNKHWDKVPRKQQKDGLKITEDMIDKLRKKFRVELKNVKNSYF